MEERKLTTDNENGKEVVKKRTRGKDKQPRKTDGYQVSSRKNLVKARENNPIVQDCAQKNVPEGYNARFVSFMMEITPDSALDVNDVAEMRKRFIGYVQKCQEWDMKVGNQAAYYAIGLNKEQVTSFLTYDKSNTERSVFLKKVQQFCAMYREGLMQDGKINPVTGIFWQKNYDGLRDQQEVVVTPNNPLGDTKSVAELTEKYLDAAYIDESAESEIPKIEQKDAESN